MRRLGAIGTIVAGAVALVVAGPGATRGEAGDAVRVDALFDNAGQVVPGQNVKVAGVPVGTVTAVDLTEDRHARVQMEIESPFAPFSADARCEIRPQSLIGERFVQCDPGTPDAGTLEAVDGETPTVPANRNSAPIDLDLVFDVLRRPYRERLAIILSELGTGLSGRGEDLNRIIRNANPALADARDLLETLNRQRAEIRAAIADTDTILASVAERPESVGRFLEGAATVTERIGRHDDAVSESVARLPGLLAEAQPALRELDGLSVEALPVVRGLRQSAPSAGKLFGQLGPLARAARPTLRDLGRAAVTGRSALSKSLAFADSLRRTFEGLRPLTPTLRELLSSLVASGGTEGLFRFFYNAALATSRFDGTSHIFPAHLVGGACSLYRTVDPPIAGCNGRFAGSFPRSARSAKGSGGLAVPQLTPSEDPSGEPLAPIELPDSATETPPPAELPTAPSSNPAKGLLDFLLGK